MKKSVSNYLELFVQVYHHRIHLAILCIAMLLMVLNAKAESAPTITSFTPSSGAIGTSVTITGTNFDATFGSNLVFFGATQATVTAGNATSITVTVPAGATYQPITVLSNGLIASSAASFITTFDGGAIDATSFAAKADQTTGTNPASVAIGDLDGDGKSDLAVANSNSSTVSVFRNTSTGAGTVSYADKVDFATGTGPRSVAIGDLDGDGKMDLAVANLNSSTVSVFRNTSTGAGTVSYADKVDFATGSSPYSVAIGDLDGDGKLDLAVTNQLSTTVSVLRNTSTGAGAVSYAAKEDYSTGTSPRSVAIGDLDGDGKLDLAVTNSGSNTVSVFSNTGTGAGTVSFATKVDYTTERSPVSVAIGDLDGDGKLDLAVVNYRSSRVSVFRNTGTVAGTVSYAAKVDYVTSRDPSSVAIGDLDGDGKLDLAVTNQFGSGISVFRNTSTGAGTVTYAAKVDYTTGTATAPVSVAIGDLDGDGKPDLAVAIQNSSTVSVFRNTVSLPPPTVVSVFVPSNATYITGQNLDFTVNFSKNITVVTSGGTPQLALTIGSTAQQAVYHSGSGTSALVFRYIVQAGDLDTDGIAVGSLAANGGTLRDADNVDATLTLNSVGVTSAVLVDAVAPTIASVAVPLNATYIAGQNLDFVVNFSKNITVVTSGGTPQLALTIGSTTQQADYHIGSGTSALVFRYIVQAGDLDTDGIAVGSLAANGGTLRDADNVDATLTLNSVGVTSAVLVDAVAPTVASVAVPSNATYIAGQNLDFVVNFNKNITVVTSGGTPQLALTIGTAQQADYHSGSGTSELVFRYTVQVGDLDTDGIAVGTLAANGGTLKDEPGNDATLTLNSVAATNGVFVDASAPTLVSSLPADGATGVATNSDIVLTFNENIAFGTGNIQVIDVTDGSSSFTIDAASPGSQASITNNVLTINPIADLDDNSDYAVQMAATAINDVNGNSYAGITDNTTLNFSTVITPTITFDNITVTYGAADFNIAATSNSAGTITYAIVGEANGTSLSGTNNETVTLGNVGTVTIRASQEADGVYTTSTKDITLTIAEAALTVTADAGQTKVYGESDPALTYTITGFVNGDVEADLTTAVSIGRAAGESVGDYTITPSGAANANYTVNFVTAEFEISKKALTITGLSGTHKVYDAGTTASATSTAALQGIVNSDDVTIAGTPTFTFASANVGTGIAISTTGYTLGGTAAGNYSLTQPTLSANITTKELTITGLIGVNKAYDATTAATTTGAAALQGIVSEENVTLEGTPTFTFASANVGTGIAISTTGYTLGGTAKDNYSLTQPTLSADITPPLLSFETLSSEGLESIGLANLVLKLSTAFYSDVTVDFVVTGTATPSSDFTLANGTITFLAGSNTEQITIADIIDDAVLESNETVIITLSNPTEAELGENIEHTYTIIDNDAAKLSIADVSSKEDDGDVTITVILDHAVQGGFTVEVTTVDGTATIADGDYIAIESQTLTFVGNAGESQTFIVPIVADAKLEFDETFTVILANLAGTNLAVDITNAATITIDNDDRASVTIANVTRDEDEGRITISAVLDNEVPGGFSVDISTQDGTAESADGDYIAISAQTLTFVGTARETKRVNITIGRDKKLEADETFSVRQSNLSGTALPVNISDGATLVIRNDDAAKVTIEDIVVNEDNGSLRVKATLDAEVQGRFTLIFSTVDGTATSADNDYVPFNDKFQTFAGKAGEQHTFQISPISDKKVESDEEFFIAMKKVGVNTLPVNIDDMGRVTLLNDDNMPIVAPMQKFEVVENSPSTTLVGTVVATDADANTVFSNWEIVSGNNDVDGNGILPFTINAATGAITVNDAKDLDFEGSTTRFKLDVQVSDGTNVSSIETVEIQVTDINDEVPVIEAGQRFDIDENLANGSEVGKLLATDADKATIIFTDWKIISGNELGIFAIDTGTGLLSIANNTKLDREQIESVNLIVTVSDGESTSKPEEVTININDLNDEIPVIDEGQIFLVNENAANLTNLGIVNATDRDITPTTFINWKIVAGNDDNIFSLNPSTGALVLVDNTKIDFESQPTKFELSITVSDGVNTSAVEKVEIHLIDVNEAPSIVDASVTVGEKTPVGTLVGTIPASDPENDVLTFSIVSGNESGTFELTSSGDLIIKAPLDFDVNPTFNLLVQVSDGQLSDQANIEVIVEKELVSGINDQNDNEIRLYPNPAQNYINIEWVNFEYAIVTDLSGKQLFSSNNQSFDIRNLPSGVYLITLIGNNKERIIRKLIKD